MLIEPFRTVGNDADGEIYAQRQGLEFPFPNDYYDAAIGRRHSLEVQSATTCTGIILVRYREPLEDHVVDCADLINVAGRLSVPVAVWHDGASVVQVSELYRP